MISLLQRCADADSSSPVLAERSAALLEWTRLTAQISSHCMTVQGAALIHARRPTVDRKRLVLEHALADELRKSGEVDQWPPLVEVGPALELVEQPPPVRLEGPDLVHVASVAEELDSLREYFLAARDACPLWGEAAVQMTSFSGMTGAIRRALDPSGTIVDSASGLLARLRRSIAGQERAVRQEIQQAMSHARQSGWTTGSEVTLHGDRFCIPMRSGDSRRVVGIVHDRSATGATLFVEPAPVVRLSNDLAATRLEIAAEEARILFELNRHVEQTGPAFAEAARLMVLLDTVRAGLLWSRSLQGNRPTLSDEGRVRIQGGRHPLLVEALGHGDLAQGRAKVVPLDLEIPDGIRSLVISGPNAGGKSVALKSVGVFCMLAQCGWDIPAREDTILPMVSRLLVNLGDDQSIAESLSSFSAHLGHLARFLREAGPRTLVLCDEIGSGTDPQEGTGLAFAVLEELADAGALVLASTHFGLLKAAVHDHPLMVNAAMDYDEDGLDPLFTFRIGDPGTSHAFDIARRMGLPDPVLARARAMAGEERVQIERLLTDLDRRARDLAVAEAEVRGAAQEARSRSVELERRLKGIEKEKREVLGKAKEQVDSLTRQGRQAIEKAVRDIRSSGADKTVVQSSRQRIADLAAGVVGPADRSGSESVVLAEGMLIRIPHLNLKGRVVEVRGDKVVAMADHLKLTLDREAVEPADSAAARPEDPPGPDPTERTGGWAWHGSAPAASPEIDLRGETGPDGWDQLDRLIDRAIPAGLNEIRVIHGFGTGRLRDFLIGQLNGDPRVQSTRDAAPNRGGAGVTVVILAGD